jgi:LmbE family N-acetylglucosaminyl deacetylase
MSLDDEKGGRESGPLIVVAHPDDETLWMEPWLSADSVVVVALPDHPRDDAITTARVGIRDVFPYGSMEFLPLHSIDVLGRSDWRRRAPAPYGVELRPDCPAEISQAYIENYGSMCELLDPYLEASPVVYTHNPWGEYGHEEHVQVCRAVLDTGAKHGNCVWAWDGLSVKQLSQTSMRLRHDYFDRGLAELPGTTRTLDLIRYRALKQLYQDAAAWTWDSSYEPPPILRYVELMHNGVELLPPSPPSRAGRAAGILVDHVSHVPRAARRWVRQGRLRGF